MRMGRGGEHATEWVSPSPFSSFLQLNLCHIRDDPITGANWWWPQGTTKGKDGRMAHDRGARRLPRPRQSNPVSKKPAKQA